MARAMAKSKSMVKQLELPIPQRGGARKGAGRPRTNARDTVAHVRRETFESEHPVQVTMRL